MSINLESSDADVVRATITYHTYPIEGENSTSFKNCVGILSSPRLGGGGHFRTNSATNGWNGGACYELFRTDGGDFIEKTVDKATAQSGETVTYTISVTTSSDYWGRIDLQDEFPAGFTLDESSIECSATVPDHLSDPCYAIIDNTLVVSAMGYGSTSWEWIAPPITFTVSFSGVVIGSAGDVIENEACSKRQPPEIVAIMAVGVGDLYIPNGGVICSLSVTTIIDPPRETPTATPTETPSGTPTETATETPIAGTPPAGTPLVTEAPSEPAEVTGLPNTGGSNRSSAIGLIFLAVSVGLLLATASCMRATSSRR